jgi:hypothetical protein
MLPSLLLTPCAEASVGRYCLRHPDPSVVRSCVGTGAINPTSTSRGIDKNQNRSGGILRTSGIGNILWAFRTTGLAASGRGVT